MYRTEQKYNEEIVESLRREFKFRSAMEVPRLEKIVINMCVGEAAQNSKLINVAVEEVARISGQKPVVAKAKKAISNFKLRKGVGIGCYVTLRRDKMWAFLDRLTSV